MTMDTNHVEGTAGRNEHGAVECPVIEIDNGSAFALA